MGDKQDKIMKNIGDVKNGEKIIFNANRILSGNPVSGELLSQSDEWIDVKLDHAVSGINSTWDAGEVKTFRKTLITLK